MKNYKIPIMWSSVKDFNVEASSLQEAAQIALDIFMTEPDDNYLDDSVSFDEVGMKELYPNEDFNLDDLI